MNDSSLEAPSKHLKYAGICLHISSGLYLLVALIVPILFISGIFADNAADPNEQMMFTVFAVFFALLGVGMVGVVEIVATGLRRRKSWGWIGSLVLFVLYIPSLFFPLGAIGLWALLQDDAKRQCKISGF